MGQTLREKLHWDTQSGQITDADRRYLMLRADVLMGIFRKLEPQAQAQALAAFGQAVRESGSKSAQSYFQSQHNDAPRFLQTMEAYSAELGWGKWAFNQNTPGQWELIVHNSPFAAGFGASEKPVCSAIAGMLSAVGTLIAQTPVSVEETACAAQGCKHCKFVLRTNKASDPP